MEYAEWRRSKVFNACTIGILLLPLHTLLFTGLQENAKLAVRPNHLGRFACPPPIRV